MSGSSYLQNPQNASLITYRQCLVSHIEQNYSIDEIAQLCMNIGLSDEDLYGQSRPERAKSLVDTCIAKQILKNLTDYLKDDPERDPPLCADPPPGLQELRVTAYVEDAIDCILAGNFPDALRILNQTPSSQSNLPIAVFARAVAMMKGRHPNSMLRHQLEKVMSDLNQALEYPETRVAAQAVRILIMSDVHVPSGRVGDTQIDDMAKQIIVEMQDLPIPLRRLTDSVGASKKARQLIGLE